MCLAGLGGRSGGVDGRMYRRTSGPLGRLCRQCLGVEYHVSAVCCATATLGALHCAASEVEMQLTDRAVGRDARCGWAAVGIKVGILTVLTRIQLRCHIVRSVPLS